MHDLKNIFIAFTSSITSVITAVEAKTLITVISAIVLPIIFFTIGKTIDVALQMYLRKKEKQAKSKDGAEQ